MQRKILLLCLTLFVIFSTFGCATLFNEKAMAIRTTPKGRHNFDLSSGSDVGKLIIQARPPSRQLFVKYYTVSIDNHEPLEVFKYSDSEIILDAGKHELKLYIVAGKGSKWLYGETFGKIATREINIEKCQTLILEYTGPYSMFGKGKTEEKVEGDNLD